MARVGRGWVDAVYDETTGPAAVDDGGLRRRALEHVPVRCVSDAAGACAVEDRSDPSGVFTASPATLLLAGSTLPGDSGAGVLGQALFTGGQPTVIAVASFGTWDAAGRASGAGTLRVARQRTFLVEGAREAAALAGLAPPAWAADPPAGGAPPRRGPALCRRRGWRWWGLRCRRWLARPRCPTSPVGREVGAGRRCRLETRARGA